MKYLIILLALASCSTSRPRQDPLPNSSYLEAQSVQLYFLGTSPATPPVTILGPVLGESYRTHPNQPPASKSEALARLRLAALALGANAVVEVIEESWEPLDRPDGCIELERVTGLAVVLN